MCESDFRLMVSPYHEPEFRPPLIPNLVHAVERVRKWRANGVKNPSDEMYYLTEVMKREIKRQGYTGKWKPNAVSMARQLRRSYITDMENHGGWFGQWLYRTFIDLY